MFFSEKLDFFHAFIPKVSSTAEFAAGMVWFSESQPPENPPRRRRRASFWGSFIGIHFQKSRAHIDPSPGDTVFVSKKYCCGGNRG